jgi:hypothetical protein
MSIRTTKPALDEEADLRQHVEHFPVAAHELPSLTLPERIDVIERIASFVAEVLLPHAAFEQGVLYPQAARLLHERDASGDVAADRARIRELLARLVDADAADAGALQEALYALYAVLSAHFWREEAVFVRLAALPDAEVRDAIGAPVAARA